MSGSRRRRTTSHPIASEPLRPSMLDLDRRNSKIARLETLRQSCSKAAEPSTVDYEIDQILGFIQDKALNEDFSVAIQERWQTWSRHANPSRSKLASSAASELKSNKRSISESDEASDDSTAEDPSEQLAYGLSPRKKRGKAVRAKHDKTANGAAKLDVAEEWEAIRLEREAFLAETDAALPKAFRYNERQLKVYAHRLKTKYINSLDRPFEAKDVHKLLRPSRDAELPISPSYQPPASVAARAQLQPSVLAVSVFSSSIEWSKEAAAAKANDHPDASNSDGDGDDTRDAYVKRICGDGLRGMRLVQSVELLSTQTLSDLYSSILCWSDEQPERCGWRDRIRRYIARDSVDMLSNETSDAILDDDDQDTRFARFTGQRRRTDAALVIENKLFVEGVRHGDAPFEADYGTLIDEWKGLLGSSNSKLAPITEAGDLSRRLDQIGSIRVGQPYWMLHQGDCVHCFVIEQVRALRPSEMQGLRQDATASNLESAPAGSAFVPFPRVSWLSTPTMLRFAADNKHNYGLGHHILQWEGSLAVARSRSGWVGDIAGEQASNQGKHTTLNPWQVANLRTRRKDEGLLRKKQGKCLACSWRKAQVGILGGTNVRLPLTSTDLEKDGDTQAEHAVNGLDDYLVSICTACAAILGLPTLPMTTDSNTDGHVELDWDRINSAKDRQAGWTVFPLH